MSGATVGLRPAGPADAPALLDVERAAALAGFAHVFPADEHPFPSEAVLQRWHRLLADPDVRVLAVGDEDAPGRLVAHVAFDDGRVRHLAVRPEHWGRGLATTLLEHATAGLHEPVLWVLEQNHRARALYERLGWRPTGRSQRDEFAPHPLEIELVLRR